MSDKSLAYKLGIYISLAVLCFFIVLMILLLNFHIKNRKESNEGQARKLNETIIRDVGDRLIETESIARQLARQVEFYLNHKGMDDLLTGILEEYKYLESVEVIFSASSGNLKDSVFEAYIKEDRPFFSAGNTTNSHYIKEEDLGEFLPDPYREGWSEPFRTKAENKIVTVFNHPFSRRDTIRGT